MLKRNPLNAELSAMRPSLLPSLLAAAARNLARKQENGALFEVGPRFTGAMPGEQVVALAGLRFGAPHRGIGPRASGPWTPSTPRATRSRGWRRWA